MSLSTNNIVPYDLRGMRAGVYSYNNSTHAITYTTPFDIGNAISAALELKFAEGRLYAESALRRYKKKLTGGTISISVESLTQAVQASMFGAATVSTTVGSSSVDGLGYNESSVAPYLGVGFYAPADAESGSDQFIAVFIRKCRFGPPSLSYQTAGENVQWSTPTTTGEFLSPDKDGTGASPDMVEIAECSSEAIAKNWIKSKLGETVVSA